MFGYLKLMKCAFVLHLQEYQQVLYVIYYMA
jgi:hypothetical protein